MKNLTFTLLLFFSVSAFAQNADDLQKQLDTAKNPCVKVNLYTAIAANLIQFAQPKTREVTYADAGKAVDYVLKAIHINSGDGDYFALRTDYDMLSQAYFIQKKYTQAKWFALQSSNTSRNLGEKANIINSLLQLATIKMAIKDYKLAQQDLDEAMQIAKDSYNLLLQIEIEHSMAVLYDKSGNVKQAIAMQKHYSMLIANLKKAQMPSITVVAAAKTKQQPKPKVKAQIVANTPRKTLSMQYSNPLESKLNIENGIWVVKD
ncbi:hypothetical protein BEL04_16565 [Mucilaginibacter sp. PPCGB 2223]|uniref:tetratricopeptide repeat protein n=1 Tax=Mucilaginibacter sp. PPCGB 2223 TaxID=1886027 RepID=UPI000826703C|nr:tetratricopeptide repeat protein [Mucilaginibacter sp. PPCGB 2223]OCX51633.1 hypothetical protein BEL04_16565 [Mucilaginibacter sp. PPCGB 2223]